MIAAIVINVFELLAFLVGIFYYRKNKSKPTFYLVAFLGLTFLVEAFGWYGLFMEYGYFSFWKDTPFEKNLWLYNLYGIISFFFYITYFKWYLKSKNSIRWLNMLTGVFIGASLIELIFIKGLFAVSLPITNISGTLLVFFSISLYYLELLKSEKILLVHKSLPFYISVGALLFHLCTTPLFIYGSYYSNSIDPAFVSLYRQIIFGTNYLLYSIYIAGFLICYRTQNPYYPRKSF